MAVIEAFGAFVPTRIVSNDELAMRLGCDAAWIEESSGISERRYAAETESVADLAAAAAQDCLARAGRPASDVRFLIVASGSEPRRFPGPAAEVACRLGLNQVPALDVPAASSGGLIAMVLGNALAADGPVLIVAAEKMSTAALHEPLDRNVAILFGDGAGACVLSEGASCGGRIVDSVLHSDGAFTGSLALEANGRLVMDGRSVILQASRKLPRAITELLERNRMTPPDVSVFLMHQANQNLMDGVARALRVPPDRFFSNIRRYGNTSSASLLIAAAEWQATGGFRRGVAMVFAAFGAGFHWGALLAEGV